MLTIESDNIRNLTVKYYMINNEILFSRAPFVKDEAVQFSYVKPYFELVQPVSSETNITNIPFPEVLKGKNVVMEIKSDDIQLFKTHFSSQLKVMFNEKFGEFRVYNQVTMEPLSKVYVKVFSRGHNASDKATFFRDGFTDIRGKFEYANASGKSLSDVGKFAIFISDDIYGNGSCIKEADPPEKDEAEGLKAKHL